MLTAASRKFEVHATLQFPAWNERDGFHVTVTARSKREAIGRARRQLKNDGNLHGQSGRVTMRATEVEA